MRRRAVIYTRVSTEDQKDNGFSLQEQEARLTRYCQQNDFELLSHVQDGHSAKNFERPEYQKLLKLIRNKALKFDILLVTKFDRFSRDIFLAYSQVTELNRFGISIFSLQEGELTFKDISKFFPNLVQAGAAQYENMLRADNTIRGMRQAAKEGRWMGKAPIGYKNNLITKICEPDEITSKLIIEGFELMSTGIYSCDEVCKILSTKGLKCSKNNFPNILRNPFYIGKITIKAWKNELSQVVQGLHKPILGEELFKEVQEVLAGKRRRANIKIEVPDELVLRGYLHCSKCSGKMTGAASKGRSKYYYYYECQHCDAERYRSDRANLMFVEYLRSIQIPAEMCDLYYMIYKKSSLMMIRIEFRIKNQ